MEYRIRRAEFPDWEKAERVSLTHQPWLPANDIRACAQALVCGEALHVRMEAEEKDIRAEHRGLLDAVCEDSCLEFFYAPVPGDRRYLNFEWNPLGTLYLGFGAERNTRIRQIPAAETDPFDRHPFRTERGWGIEFRIPLSFIRMYFPGADFSGRADGNFYKCGDRTREPHYLAWAPLSSSTPDFHRRDDFGAFRFE